MQNKENKEKTKNTLVSSSLFFSHSFFCSEKHRGHIFQKLSIFLVVIFRLPQRKFGNKNGWGRLILSRTVHFGRFLGALIECGVFLFYPCRYV